MQGGSFLDMFASFGMHQVSPNAAFPLHFESFNPHSQQDNPIEITSKLSTHEAAAYKSDHRSQRVSLGTTSFANDSFNVTPSYSISDQLTQAFKDATQLHEHWTRFFKVPPQVHPLEKNKHDMRHIINHVKDPKARQKCFEKYVAEQPKRLKWLKQIKKTVKNFPNLNVSYNLLAMYNAASFQEALELFKKAENASLEMSPELKQMVQDTLKKSKQKKSEGFGLYGCIFLRPYFRSLMGQAHCYKKMGQWQKALDIYLRLDHLKPDYPSWQHGFVNYFSQIPLCLLYLGKTKEAKKYMDDHVDMMGYSTVMCSWLFNYALIKIILNQIKPDEMEAELMKDNSVNGEPDPRAGCLYLAITYAPECCSYLLGDRQIPNLNIPQWISSTAKPGKDLHFCNWMLQLQYASDALELWSKYPKAISLLRKYCGTVAALFIPQASEAHRTNKPHNSTRLVESLGYQVSDDSFTKLVKDGVFKNAFIPWEGTLGHITVMHGTPNMVRALARYNYSLETEFACGHKSASSAIRPLHQACYYDRDCEIIRILLNIDDCLKKGKCNLSPLQMCANQGNPRVLRLLIRHARLFNHQSELESILATLFASSCVDCVMGKEKCQRCAHSDHGHSPFCSFERCIDVLVDYGLKYRPNLDKILDERSNLKKYFLFSLERKSQGEVIDYDIPMLGKNPYSYMRSEVHAKKPSPAATQPAATSQSSAASQSTTSQPPAEKKSSEQTSAAAQNEESTPKRICSQCKKVFPRLKLCASCGQARYCSVACQKQHWKNGHREECKKIRSDRLRDEGNQKFAESAAEALRLYEQAANLYKDARLYTNIAACHLKLRNFEAALEASIKSIQLDKSWEKGYQRKIVSLHYLGRPNAQEEIDECVREAERNGLSGDSLRRMEHSLHHRQ